MRALTYFVACAALLACSDAGALLAKHRDPRTWEVLDAEQIAGWPKRVRDPRTDIVFVLVPAGEFTMGGQLIEELPRHRVRISRPFYLAENELTIAQWGRYVEENGGDSSVSFGDGPDDHAASGMSWLNGVQFCEVYGYRLPTEAEWEYAARAGADDEGAFWTDADALNEYSWNGTNAQGRPQPVRTRKPNELGLYDMLGNVWEWCADIFGGGYDVEDPQQVTVDPTGPVVAKTTEGRVLRGGSCFTHPPPRPSDRSGDEPSTGSPFYGLRVVQTLPK